MCIRDSTYGSEPTHTSVSNVHGGSKPYYYNFFPIEAQCVWALNSQYICSSLEPSLHTRHPHSGLCFGPTLLFKWKNFNPGPSAISPALSGLSEIMLSDEFFHLVILYVPSAANCLLVPLLLLIHISVALAQTKAHQQEDTNATEHCSMNPSLKPSSVRSSDLAKLRLPSHLATPCSCRSIGTHRYGIRVGLT